MAEILKFDRPITTHTSKSEIQNTPSEAESSSEEDNKEPRRPIAFHLLSRQKTTASTTVATTPKPMLKSLEEKEEDRLLAAHLALLNTETVIQDQHEVTASPIFTMPVLKHSKQLISQYGFLAGISSILENDITGGGTNISVSSPPEDPRLFFNISAPSSAFICGSQGSGKSHTLSCLLENCLIKSDASKLDNPLSSNANIKVRVLCSPTNLCWHER